MPLCAIAPFELCSAISRASKRAIVCASPIPGRRLASYRTREGDAFTFVAELAEKLR
jgi:hypothetical protein